jgi:hypothetical protein
MEAMVTGVAAETRPPAFSARAALRAATRAWLRNLWPLSATGVLLTLPGLVLELAWPGEPRGGGVRAVLLFVVGMGSGLIEATALTAGGLEALQGRRPGVRWMLRRGAASAWRLLRVSVRAFGWAIGSMALFAALIVVRRDVAFEPRSGPALLWAIAALLALAVPLLAVPVSFVRVFPLPAVVLEERDGPTPSWSGGPGRSRGGGAGGSCRCSWRGCSSTRRSWSRTFPTCAGGPTRTRAPTRSS